MRMNFFIVAEKVNKIRYQVTPGLHRKFGVIRTAGDSQSQIGRENKAKRGRKESSRIFRRRGKGF